MNGHVWKTKIYNTDCDCKQRLTIAGQLKMQQEVGGQDAINLGVGFNRLYEDGIAFVLTKTHSVITRSPMMDEEVTVETWHQGTKGVSYLRRYNYYDQNNKLIVQGVSSFCLVDIVKHAVVRPVVLEKYGINPPLEKTNLAEIPKKITIQTDNRCADYVREIRYSDIDYNSHLNNTIYGNIMLDTLPEEFHGKALSEYAIHFQKEAILGERISVTGYRESGSIKMIGKLGEKPCFSGEIKVKD